MKKLLFIVSLLTVSTFATGVADVATAVKESGKVIENASAVAKQATDAITEVKSNLGVQEAPVPTATPQVTTVEQNAPIVATSVPAVIKKQGDEIDSFAYKLDKVLGVLGTRSEELANSKIGNMAITFLIWEYVGKGVAIWIRNLLLLAGISFLLIVLGKRFISGVLFNDEVTIDSKALIGIVGGLILFTMIMVSAKVLF